MKVSKIYDNFFKINRDSIVLVSSFSILIYIFGYILFFASGYKYGVDSNLFRLNQNAQQIHSILTVSANLTVFFIFRFFLNKYLPKQIFLPIAKNSFLNGFYVQFHYY